MKHIYLCNIILALAATSLTACNDDVEHNIAQVDAPTFVGISPQTNLKAGLDSIIITYDKNIFFSSADYNKIKLNGLPPVSANVIGSSNRLLIMANIERDKAYKIEIPENIVSGPNNMPAPAISETISSQSQQISTALSNPNATLETKALYQKLLDNYGKKTFSATMADVAWNTANAEHVHNITGKYPAINAFDYIHLNASGPNSWINYADITPVKNWADNGGIVAAGWHWNVPTSNPYVSTVPVSLYDGPDKEMPADWSGNIQLTNQATKDILANASIGSKLVVSISNVAPNAQGSIKKSDWAGLTDEAGTSYDYFDISGNSYSITLDQTTLHELQANGFIVGGHDYTVTGITIEAAGEVKYAFYADKNDFKADDAVIEGTWENRFIKSDLEKMANHLLLLQSQKIPVLWRPLHEAAGKWFWWGNGSAESYKQLWRMMYDYFKQRGINNLIWIWTSEGNDSDWYPGDQYVDMIGTDMYGQNGEVVEPEKAADRFNELAYRYPNKMITLSECGTVSDIPDQWKGNANWSYFMPWYNSGTTTHADDAWWINAMKDPNVISR